MTPETLTTDELPRSDFYEQEKALDAGIQDAMNNCPTMFGKGVIKKCEAYLYYRQLEDEPVRLQITS